MLTGGPGSGYAVDKESQKLCPTLPHFKLSVSKEAFTTIWDSEAFATVWDNDAFALDLSYKIIFCNTRGERIFLKILSNEMDQAKSGLIW